MREPDGVGDGGEGPVRGEVEEFGALNLVLDHMLIALEAISYRRGRHLLQEDATAMDFGAREVGRKG